MPRSLLRRGGDGSVPDGTDDGGADEMMAAAHAYGGGGSTASPTPSPGGGGAGGGGLRLTIQADGLIATARQIEVPRPASAADLETEVRTQLGLACEISLSVYDEDFDELIKVSDHDIADLAQGTTLFAKATTTTFGETRMGSPTPRTAAGGAAVGSGEPPSRQLNLTVHSNNRVEHLLSVRAGTMAQLKDQIQIQLQLLTPIVLVAYDSDFGEFAQVTLDEIASQAHDGHVHIFPEGFTSADSNARLRSLNSHSTAAATTAAATTTSSMPLARMFTLDVCANELVSAGAPASTPLAVCVCPPPCFW
jgi:hypothetical protein